MPKISILTPTYNRAEFLPKLAESLQKQSFQDIEWIIGNDGSNDNSDEVIRSFAEIVQFPIIYINSSHRVGKSKIDNLLIDESKGEYILWCDSDDYFVEDALEFLLDEVKKIPESEKKLYTGVLAQNIDTKGNSQTFSHNAIPQKSIHVLYDSIEKYVKGDGTNLVLSEHLKGKEFLEVDFLITESSLLEKVFHNKKVIISPKIVKIMNRTAENSISFGKKLSYCRGSAYAISEMINKEKYRSLPKVSKIKLILNYFRYSIHGSISLNKAQNLWPVLKDNKFLLIFYPFSVLLCLRDTLLGKVEKTHIEFDHNVAIAKVTKESL